MRSMICAGQEERAGRRPEAAGIREAHGVPAGDEWIAKPRQSPAGISRAAKIYIQPHHRNSGNPRPATDSTGPGPATTPTPAAASSASSAPEASAEQYTTNRSSAAPSQVTRFIWSQKQTKHGFVADLFSTVQIATAHLAQANCSASFTAFASAVPVLNLTMIPFTSCISNLLMTYTLAIPLLLYL